MSTPPIPPVSIPARALQATSLLWNVPFGMIAGCNDARNLYRGAAALPEISLALAHPSNGNSIGGVAHSFFKWIFGDVIGKGAVALRESGFLSKLSNIFSKEGFETFRKILTSGPGGIGPRGALLAVGAIGLGVTGLILGTREAVSSWGKVSDLQKGYVGSDAVNSSLVHGLQAGAGVLTAIGGLAMINPIIGLPILAAGITGSMVMGVVKHGMGGFNWFRYPDLAPYPLNLFFGLFRNRGLYEGR